jgi:uncharacterized protein YijF (DUF1287 family)
MAQSLTDALQHGRLIVVAVDKPNARIRVKSEADMCTDLSCHDQTLIVTDEGKGSDLDVINEGDIVTLRASGDRAHEIVVVRRVWEELSSPEF